jgi:IS1 family transposase
VPELDELWPFVLKRARKRWIWIALCRASRQVVAYVIGDRSQASCRQLWERIPAAYKGSHCYSDFREAYSLVIPAEQHTAAGKETGLTARRTVEQHFAATTRTLCQKVVIVFQVRGDARDMFAIVSTPLQSRMGIP